jgi:hypothetical protein
MSARIPRFAPHGLNLTSGTAYSAHSSCGLRAVRPSSLALHFFPHTRPPDTAARLEYQGSLVNTYSSLDLRSILRHRPKRALALTRSGASVDLPGARYTMTGSDDDAPAVRGPPLGSRARRSDARESSRAWRLADFPAPSSFTTCTVNCHEDVPHHIYGLFQALGIQYRYVLTRGPLGREFLKAEDLAIDYAKEESWMAAYEHERDLLEDTVYRRLVSLWSEFSDAYAVFDQYGPAHLLCAQKVWEALLAAFPLKHKRCLDPRRHGSARTCSLHCTLTPTAGAARLARSAPGRDTRSGQGALARRHTDGPLWAALLKTTVMCKAWRRCTTHLGILLELVQLLATSASARGKSLIPIPVPVQCRLSRCLE